MNQLKSFTVFLCMAWIFFACSGSPSGQNSTPIASAPHPPTTNPNLQKFAGGYIVEVKGIPDTNEGEIYVLHQNGSAKWMWIFVQSNGATDVKSEKTGTWEAAEDRITIRIKGNSGNIVETYSLVGGKLVYGDRSLKRTE